MKLHWQSPLHCLTLDLQEKLDHHFHQLSFQLYFLQAANLDASKLTPMPLQMQEG